jgi:hypothetical protein
MAISSLTKFTVPIDGQQSQGMLMPKLKYRFRVKLIGFGVTSGDATELTKQVIDVTRPTVAFDPITLDIYNSRVYLAGKHTWTALTLNVRDSADGKTNKLIGEQLQKQFDFLEMSSAAKGLDYKFTTQIEILDGGNGANTPVVLETWEAYGCYLENVNYQNLAYSANEQVTIQMTIKYDNAAQTVGVGATTVATQAGRSIANAIGNATGPGTNG